jgi:hypothetical protein
MSKRDLLILLLFAVSVFCQAKDVTVKSPNGALAVTVSNTDGQISYSVELNGKNVIMESSLGLVTSIGDLTQGMTMVNVQTNKVEKHYAMRTTKASSADYLANELALTFQNEQGRVLGVTTRADTPARLQIYSSLLQALQHRAISSVLHFVRIIFLRFRNLRLTSSGLCLPLGMRRFTLMDSLGNMWFWLVATVTNGMWLA